MFADHIPKNFMKLTFVKNKWSNNSIILQFDEIVSEKICHIFSLFCYCGYRDVIYYQIDRHPFSFNGQIIFHFTAIFPWQLISECYTVLWYFYFD